MFAAQVMLSGEPPRSILDERTFIHDREKSPPSPPGEGSQDAIAANGS
jgi:hypothetical protein